MFSIQIIYLQALKQNRVLWRHYDVIMTSLADGDIHSWRHLGGPHGSRTSGTRTSTSGNASGNSPTFL